MPRVPPATVPSLGKVQGRLVAGNNVQSISVMGEGKGILKIDCLKVVCIWNRQEIDERKMTERQKRESRCVG